jgi:hypothetical protein
LNDGVAERGDADDRVTGGGTVADEDQEAPAGRLRVGRRPGMSEVTPDVAEAQVGEWAALFADDELTIGIDGAAQGSQASVAVGGPPRGAAERGRGRRA